MGLMIKKYYPADELRKIMNKQRREKLNVIKNIN